MNHPHVALIVPTYREAQNVRSLVARVEKVRDSMRAPLDLVIVDDRSEDGTREIVQALQGDPANLWIQFLEREKRDGLSGAVLAGFRGLKADVYVVMDADLSHPPERIPAMVELVWNGDSQGAIGMVLGSRYAPGGSTDEEWGLLNRLNSRIATSLARSFTSVSDPMTGFFAVRGDVLERAPPLKPVGYKIALELMVRAPVGRVVEVPIQFGVREAGRSKTTMRQRVLYLKHLRRLALYRNPAKWMLFHFMVVGMIGTAVNLGLLTSLSVAGVDAGSAVVTAVLASMLGNFVLNRRFSFPDGRRSPLLKLLLYFVAAAAPGVAINIGVTLTILRAHAGVPIQLAALAGILAGMGSNFFLARAIVFPRLQDAA